jgi:hypothetical protein
MREDEEQNGAPRRAMMMRVGSGGGEAQVVDEKCGREGGGMV